MRLLPAAALLTCLLGGCGGPSSPATTASEKASDEQPWVVVDPGSPTPSVTSARAGSPKPALPPVSFLPTAAACRIAWPSYVGQVYIPMMVTPGPGSFTVQWPNRYGHRYRIAAVPQSLVSGAQPEPAWKTITTGSECEAGGTITGLNPGESYIVWLDAPDTPRDVDGTRSLYTGRSGIMRPN
nr:hypothetical protein [uncultured Actinoplanes sp.]